MSDLEKNKKTKDSDENEISDIQYTDKKSEPKDENGQLDELEFISEETVKDKSKMAGQDTESEALVTKKKTRRRSLDTYEAKKEKSIGFFKNHLAMVGIGCLVIVAVICAIVVITKNHKEKQEVSNKDLTLSEQSYEKDEHQEINELITKYYAAYAAGDTETIQQYAYPMTDTEKSYISVYSKQIESYENLICYTKVGEDEQSFIVSAAMEVKFKGVSTAAPGMDFFYVRTADDGSVYIDNTYSQFNLLYKENPLDANVQTLIDEYEAGDDVKALLASVDLRYTEALEQDADLKKMIEETVTTAISAWKTDVEEQQKAKELAAQQEVAQEEKTDETDTAATDTKTDDTKTEKTSKKVTEKTKKDWVYATENIIIRRKWKASSKALASASRGSELRRLAVTTNGWSKVKTGDIVGYVKNEYISKKKPSTQSTSSSSSTTALEEGSQIYLENTVNVRTSMSESAERVGVAYAGETVTVIMSYDDGWTRVNWNGQTGYVKTDVLTGN